MARIHGWYDYDDALRPGQAEDGGLSQLLYDSEGKLADHATFHPDDPTHENQPDDYSGSDGEAEDDGADLLALAVIAAGAAAVIGGYVVIRKAAPRVQRLLTDQALPAVQSFWDRVRGHRSESQAIEVPASEEVVGEPQSQETEIDSQRLTMAATEWYTRFRLMFAARAVSDEQWKLLASVRVVDDEAVPALQEEMVHSTPVEVVERVALMLEATPSSAPEKVSSAPDQHPEQDRDPFLAT